MSKWLERQQRLEEEEAREQQTQYIDALAGPAPFDEGYSGDPPKPGTTYTWMKDDQLPIVAKRLGLTRQELIEHNGIADPNNIQPGTVLHLPVAQPVKQERLIRYQILPEPRDMHVAKAGGCKKWSFGNVRTYDDFSSHGFYPQNTNIKIVAVAQVPVEDKDNPDAEVGYYMDALAVADYADTGRVRFTVGYRWVDLAEGLAEVPAAQPVAAPPTVTGSLAKTMDVAPPPLKHDRDGFDPAFVEQRLADAINNGTYQFLDSYQVLPVPIPCEASIPEGSGEIERESGRRFIWVHDFLTKRPDRRLFDGQEVVIGATFNYGGQLHGRPELSIKNHNFFAIPTDFLEAEHEVYNTELDAETKAATNKFTFFERYLWVPVSKVIHWRTNKNNQKEQ